MKEKENLILEEIKKDTKRILELLESKKETKIESNLDKATDKQLFFLKKAGIEKANLTKTEAFQLIKEIKEKGLPKNKEEIKGVADY